MSVREYIGARYIPLFADPIEWDSTRTYEPLVIVKNNGASYVSRRYVPEGTPITNTQYWIMWADFDAQLEQYRYEVQQLSAQVDDIVETAESAKTTANAASATATAAQSAVAAEKSARQAEDTAIRSEIKAAKARELWVIIGDSFSDTSQPSFNNWVKIIQNMRPNITIKNYSKSGAGYVHATNTVFPSQVQQAINDSSFTNADVTRVIVYGGINDIASNDPLNSVYTAAQNCANLIKQNFTNAEVGFYPNWSANVDMTAAKQQYLSYIANAINPIGYQLTLDSAFLLMNYRVTDVYQSDTIHPNQLGHGIIAAYMLNGYKGGLRNRVQGPLTAAALNTIQTPTVLSQNPNAVLTAVTEPLDSVSYENGYLNITMPQRTYKVTGLTNQTVGLSFPINSDFKKYAPLNNANVPIMVSLTRGYHALNPRAWIAGNNILVQFEKFETNAWPADETGINIIVSFDAHIQLF